MLHLAPLENEGASPERTKRIRRATTDKTTVRLEEARQNSPTQPTPRNSTKPNSAVRWATQPNEAKAWGTCLSHSTSSFTTIAAKRWVDGGGGEIRPSNGMRGNDARTVRCLEFVRQYQPTDRPVLHHGPDPPRLHPCFPVSNRKVNGGGMSPTASKAPRKNATISIFTAPPPAILHPTRKRWSDWSRPAEGLLRKTPPKQATRRPLSTSSPPNGRGYGRDGPGPTYKK